MQQPTYLFIHGDYHGAWCRDGLRTEMRDTPTVAVDLPSSGTDPATLGSRCDDISTIRAALSSIEGDIVAVAHSAGAIAAAEALASDQQVIGLVFIAAVVLDEGQTTADVLAKSSMTWVDAHPEAGYVQARDPESTFYANVDSRSAEAASSRLTKKSLQDVLTPAAVGKSDWAWPTAYVVCDQDRAIDPRDEEAMGSLCSFVFHLDSSHSPFLSMPTRLASLLAECADRFRSLQ